MALALPDMRLAGGQARSFSTRFMKLGFLPATLGPRAALAALVGPARAKMILDGGAVKADADERPAAGGLIDRITAPGTLLDGARALAADALRRRAPTHVAAIKRLVAAE